MSKRVIVIGSGFGGLAVAIRLAARGYPVTIFEKRDKPGGRAYVYEMDGFKFDGGPTVITAPFLFDELFELAGRKREDYVTFVPVNPFYRIFDAEGRSFEYNNQTDLIYAQIEKWNPADKEGYRRFLESTRPIFEKGFLQLADQPFTHLKDMLKVAPDLVRLRSYQSVYTYVSQFVQNDFLRQVFSFHPLLIGGNPYDASSIYAMIHYLEREWGVYFAMGGTGALVNALVRLFQEMGGRLVLNAEVDEILVDTGRRRVQGIRLKDGSVETADIIISNADVAFTYRYLIPEVYRRKYTNRRIERMRYSMSLFVIYFGTRRRYLDSRLAHHNIILGPRYKGLLDDIFRRKVLAEDFSLYLHMPTLTDPSLAPEGHEAFYVLSPVPHLGGKVNWEETAIPYKNRILEFLEAHYLPGLRENLVVEHYIDPLHFRDVLNSYLGSAFSVEPILTQSAWFRPHNRSEEFENLYFVGAGTHPGAGLPGVVSSAKVVEKLILNPPSS
ncbi:phytoene dehydrogenase [Thermanaerothrix daxensis]|uniref:Phytoene dehydrogenase n=1 Tax=Thermanaerothrix daxensis TaxID=869279 RepID=A0A0P6XGG2_9CHLR|nr:phytoene desaturase [Thermanaerothrix daxensis]KPL82355.1 phytoene dehydrogenase [Thermanaerothrix daxensis]